MHNQTTGTCYSRVVESQRDKKIVTSPYGQTASATGCGVMVSMLASSAIDHG